MRIFLTVCLYLLFSLCLRSQTYERDYQRLIQQQLGGEMEVPVQSGRVDILNAEYAIEVEFADKWKQSIGQALWYGLQTNRTPGIVLIKRDRFADNKYVLQLGSALSYANLDQVKVWVWPDDFSNVTPAPSATRQLTAPAGEYWLNTNTGSRHNSTCRNFNNTKRGRFCGPDEGRACGICGG